jgi:hypothetical protein
LEDAAVSELLSVALFFDDGQHKHVRRFVSVQHYSRSAGARLGLTVRVIVADSSDRFVREWKYGQGVTFHRRICGRSASGQHRHAVEKGLSQSGWLALPDQALAGLAQMQPLSMLPSVKLNLKTPSSCRPLSRRA